MARSAKEGDFELLSAWRDGDQYAGKALFERHFECMYRFFRSKVEHEAEDLVQQTFLSCVENRDEFRGDSSFRTYLYTVARSRLFDAFRKWQRLPEATDVAELSLADMRTSPSTWLAREDERRLLMLALDRLPMELHLAVELFYFEDMSAKDVSQILGVPEGTVRSRIRRAIETLRTEIARLGKTPGAVESTLDTLAGLVASKE